MWGQNNGQDIDQHVMILGMVLSKTIDCPVRYPAYDKRMFECMCGITFPLFIIEGGDVDAIVERHDGGPDG